MTPPLHNSFGATLGRAATLLVAVAVGPIAAAAPPSGYRELAPGALTVIPADTAAEDTVRRRDLQEVTVACPVAA